MSGTIIGLNPLLMTLANAQLINANSNIAPAPVRYTKRLPLTLLPVSKSNIPSFSPISTWFCTGNVKSRCAPTVALVTVFSSDPSGTSGCVKLGNFCAIICNSASSAARSTSSAASLSLSSLPSATSASRVSFSIFPFILFAFRLRFSRISSHAKFNAFNASYLLTISLTFTSTLRTVAFLCTASALSRTYLKSIAAFHANCGFVPSFAPVDDDAGACAAAADACAYIRRRAFAPFTT
mmetsp:Transcript_6873/g.25006  ORF Transcript_6873/g.25006 Transcript_6873/m.25006 type:complete len:238 (-) Transcript_6873:181-894(-)